MRCATLAPTWWPCPSLALQADRARSIVALVLQSVKRSTGDCTRRCVLVPSQGRVSHLGMHRSTPLLGPEAMKALIMMSHDIETVPIPPAT